MMRVDRMRRSRIAWLAAIAFAFMLPAWGDEGRIPIWEPTVIDRPGHYVLTRDISATVDSTRRGVIDIAANDVTLDLNGFDVSGTNDGCDIECGVIRTVSGVENAVIQNGSVGGLGALAAVAVVNTSNYTVRDLSVSGSGLLTGIGIFGPSQTGRILGNTIRSAGDCIDHGGSVVLIENNVIRNCAQNGIRLAGAAGTIVRGNTVNSGGVCIRVLSSFNLLENNLLTTCDTGLLFDAGSNNVYRGNVSRGNGTADFTDLGTANTSAGDNFLPTLQ